MCEIIVSLQVLRKHGFRPSEDELKAMIANCEINEKNGGIGIDFNEFIAMMTRQDIYITFVTPVTPSAPVTPVTHATHVNHITHVTHVTPGKAVTLRRTLLTASG